MEWYLAVLKKYADFSGRARRKEYWMFFLFNVIFALAMGLLSAVPAVGGLFKILAVIYSLALLVPGLAVTVRRLHDSGKSGWYILISLIPLVGTILLLVAVCKDSQLGENQYGECPKQTI